MKKVETWVQVDCKLTRNITGQGDGIYIYFVYRRLKFGCRWTTMSGTTSWQMWSKSYSSCL